MLMMTYNRNRVRIDEEHYEANTTTVGWKEADVYWRNNWLFSSYGGSIYFVMYFANSDTPREQAMKVQRNYVNSKFLPKND